MPDVIFAARREIYSASNGQFFIIFPAPPQRKKYLANKINKNIFCFSTVEFDKALRKTRSVTEK